MSYRTVINEIQSARDRAERAIDLHEAWRATLEEMTLRWRAAGKPDVEPHNEVALMESICIALLKKNRSAALTAIERWRNAWLVVLRQRDFTSMGKLNVIDFFRRVKGEIAKEES